MICSTNVTTLTIQLQTHVLRTLIVFSESQITVSKHFPWFNNNHMRTKPEKSHLILSSKTPKKAHFGEVLVESSSTEKLIGIQIDSDLTFDVHISSICN